MNIKPLERDYHLSDSELALFASNLVTFITRDAVSFAERGIDALAITALGNKEDEFEAFPTDPEYKALVTIAAEDKDADRAQLHSDIRGITDRAMIKWGAEAGRYKRFEVKDLTNMSDKDLHFAARRVVRIGTDYLLDLAAEGLTQAMLDVLTALAQDFEDHLNALGDAIADRDEKTEERIALGNELYALVAKYCEIGKVIWKETSEAKYNDYVIYPTTTEMPGKVQNMGYDYGTHTVSWDAAAHAEDYQLERKFHSDPDWTVVYEGADTSVVNDPVTPGQWFFRCRGQNENGYGDWSDELMVLMPV